MRPGVVNRSSCLPRRPPLDSSNASGTKRTVSPSPTIENSAAKPSFLMHVGLSGRVRRDPTSDGFVPRVRGMGYTRILSASLGILRSPRAWDGRRSDAINVTVQPSFPACVGWARPDVGPRLTRPWFTTARNYSIALQTMWRHSPSRFRLFNPMRYLTS